MNKQNGFTLIELLIAMAISLIVIAAVSTVYISMTRSNIDYLKLIRLNHELRSSLSLITRDIRRAGHNQDAANNIGNNQFSSSNVTELKNITAASTADISFSYDFDGDASINGFGYRLNAGAIQYCTKPDSVCTVNNADWQNLTDPSLIEITDLGFDIESYEYDSVVTKEVAITVTGRLTNDNDFVRTLSETVKIRNEHSN